MTNDRETVAGVIDYESDCKRAGLGYRFFKRFFDLTFSFVGITIALVPMLIIALLIKLDSRGPVMFRQHRVGRDGELFRIYKFRSMKTSAPSDVATKDLTDSSSHITKIGAFLRKTSIDELPQLFNVFKGEMSFVGPRPLIPGETEIHSMRTQAGVYEARPGVTGWAQVNGRDDISDELKVMYDKEYIERKSIGFDLHIMLRTIGVVAKKDGYKEGEELSVAKEDVLAEKAA